MAAIEVRDVHKEYQRDKQKIPVLSGLSLAVDQGDFVALMGPLGSGKTTLLNLVGGIDQPTRGSSVVHRTDIAGCSCSASSWGWWAGWPTMH